MPLRPLSCSFGISWWTLLLLQFFTQPYIVRSSGCYYAYNGTVLSSPNFVSPCTSSDAVSTNSSILNCCDVSAHNICMSNGLCYEPDSPDHNYYLSPCTDKNYAALECPTYCMHRVDKNRLDVVYDSENDIWRCCSTAANGDRNCSAPTDESFSAPAPDKLSTVFPTSKPKTTTASSSSTAPASNSQNSNGAGGLSMSDKIALGVGIGVGLPSTLATIAGAAFACLALRKRSQKQRKTQQESIQSVRPTELEESISNATAPERTTEIKEEGVLQ